MRLEAFCWCLPCPCESERAAELSGALCCWLQLWQRQISHRTASSEEPAEFCREKPPRLWQQGDVQGVPSSTVQPSVPP